MIGAGEVRHCQGTVSLPGGTFIMGCDDADKCDPDEKPVHEVTVSPFEMDRCEFTEWQMEKLKEPHPEFDNIETDCDIDEPWETWTLLKGLLPDSWKEFFGIQEERRTETCDLPLNNVSWSEADAICRARGMRLPTEAEWEYAAHGEAGTDIYPVVSGMSLYDQYGNMLAQFGYPVAKYYPDERAQVGSYAPNSFGLYDLAGNVWEWVADWYGPYSGGAAKDPTGPARGDFRVIRGGSWYGYGSIAPIGLEATERYRGGLYPDDPKYIGFRCVAALKTPEAK